MKKIYKKIHIFGASGSGTTTLAQNLSKKYNYTHLDTDKYYWMPTNPPFEIPRPIIERQELLERDLKKNHQWILSGSLCGWGDLFIQYFDLVIFLWIPPEIRLERLKKREYQRYGDLIQKNKKIHQKYVDFIDWASKYDEGDLNVRSKALHEKWMKKISCKILKLENFLTIDEQIEYILNFT